LTTVNSGAEPKSPAARAPNGFLRRVNRPQVRKGSTAIIPNRRTIYARSPRMVRAELLIDKHMYGRLTVCRTRGPKLI
jgi:hypothetical protein